MHDARVAPYAVVVDDNPVVMLEAADLLADAGFSAFTAPDSDTALGWLNEYDGRVRLLFTNVEIPGAMDGFALARLAATRWPDMAILVASGRFAPDQGAMPRDAIFLAKPFSAVQVNASLRKLLARKDPYLLDAGLVALDAPAL